MKPEQEPLVSVERNDDLVEVTGQLTIATAPQAIAAASGYFESGRALRFDLGKLRQTDSAALAVLLEWLRKAARMGVTVEYTHVPERLLQLAEISDLEDVLGFRKNI